MNIGDLVKGYSTSREFRSLSKASKKSYGYAIAKWEPFLTEDTSKATDIALSIRDELWDDRPGMARLFLGCSSAMFGWAEKRRLLTSNPIKGISRPKIGAHKQWPDEVVTEVLEEAPDDIRLVCMIGLHTAQRIGDICSAKLSDVRDGVWHVKQSKTGHELRLPLTRAILEKIEGNGVWMLGKNWKPEYLSHRVTKYLQKKGHEGLTFHGLRKVAASKMAESGCTVEELASITGQKTLQVVAHYIKGADQAKLARRAMEKVYGEALF